MDDPTSRDRALARRMLSGDEHAFGVFFDWHFPRLYRFALKRLNHNSDDAEEAAQAAMCKAIEKLATYRGEAPLFTWLCTFCRHEISARYRRREREAPAMTLLDDLPEVQGVLDSLVLASGEGAEVAMQREETRHLVHLTLDRLPFRYGFVLESKYIRGMTMKEIAAELSTTPKAVESLLTRSRHAFRDAFAGVVGGLTPLEAGKGGA